MTRRSYLRLGGPVSVPVVLPLVIVRPDGAGTVAVTLDGGPVSDGPIPRVQLGEALSQIVEQVGAAVRVEVHQPDGAVHADILTPPAHQPDQPDQPAPTSDRQRRRGRRSSAEVGGGGFEPGEAVHVGAIVAAAGTDGDPLVDLNPRLARNDHGRVLAVGAPSGATHQLPA